MPNRHRPKSERMALAILLVGVGAVMGCGEEPALEQESAEPLAQVASPDEVAQDTAPRLRRFLPDEMRRSTRALSFAHEAHVEIACSVCHELPEAHTTHDAVECADCHRASALATVRDLRPDQCAACHHGAQQALECLDCHEGPGAVVSEQVLALEVWSAPRTRGLAFDHEAHVELNCLSCHRSSPSLTPAESCETCHADHHAVAVRCQSCHTPPAPTAHDVQSHLTCSGSGCHSAPEVEAIADDRAVCLACHTDQEDHEPQGACIECHRVRPGLERPGP